MFKRIFVSVIIGIVLLSNSSCCFSFDSNSNMCNPILKCLYTINKAPEGRNPPFLATFNGNYALKADKYLEATIDLGQGVDGNLRMTGPMTLTTVFQLAKQWPMKAALISKWGFIRGQAAYELGLTPDRKIYLQLSTTGNADDNYFKVISSKAIEKEEPVVVTAIFDPGKEAAIYIDGQKAGSVKKDVPAKCFDGSADVKLLPRFEGIFAGALFYDRVLTEKEIKDVSKQLKGMLPADAPYVDWKVNEKRNIIIGKAEDYLGTTAGVKLYKEIDISEYKGSYICPGDLDNDGRVDFLLFKNGNTYTVPGRLIAVDFDGKTLWEKGDKNLMVHESCGSAPAYEKGTSPAMRGIATVFDIDQDGKSEVISELWENNKPMLYILDGATGEVKRSVESPLSLSVRQPREIGDRQSSRTHPLMRIAYLNGKDKPPCIIVKYEASNGLPCQAFALDNKLNVIWHIKGTSHSMGHIPSVGDVDNDGKDEVLFGHMLADDNGKVMWDKGEQFIWHADCTGTGKFKDNGEIQILIGTCGVGPLYCLDYKGNILWKKTREEISHGQALWVGNFVEGMKEPQIIACTGGHTGQFALLRGCDGQTLANFTHRKILGSYPDYPQVVNWNSMNVQSLWIPQDRILVDGLGNIVAELGDYDKYVQEKLHCGSSWRPVAAQVFALDIMGDDRDELIMYEPYAGESIFIFYNPNTQPDMKKYIQKESAYNIRSYF